MGRRTTAPRLLTQRELRIVGHLANGLTFDEIGRRMFLSPHTVKEHIFRARNAIGARNKVHLVALAVGTGQLKLEVKPRG